MKKIMFYNGQLFMGGIERVAISYLQGLSKEKDLDINLVIKENNPERNVFFKEIPSKIKIDFIKTERMVKYREHISKNKNNIFYRIIYFFLLNYERIYMKKWLKNYCIKNKFDLIIDFDMSLGKYLDVIKAPKIGWVHFSLKSKKGSKKRRFEKRLKKYEKIVTICDEMKEEALDLFNLPKEKVVRIYNPFDIELVRKKSLLNVEDKDKKYLEKNFMIGVSRLVKGKGREDLIEVYSKLKQRGIKEKLYILGDGSQKPELEKKIKTLGLEDDVFLLGQKENPYPWMRNAKLFLHSSYGEGLPTVFLESMICETPVIAYDCPTGPKEILGNGKYGVLVKTGDKKQFEEEVFSLLNDKMGIENYIKQFPEKLREFEIKINLLKLKDLINKMI